MIEQQPSFTFRGHEYAYFVHKINETGSNERCVEIPISLPYADRNMDMLEFGDVLTQYGYGGHPVIDLKTGNIREDIREWSPPQIYGLCVSISTLEHVGEGTPHVERDLRAVLIKLRSCCQRLFATIPLGYSKLADSICKEHFNQRWYMQRIGKRHWVECEEIEGSYNKPFQFGNSLLIGGWGCE